MMLAFWVSSVMFMVSYVLPSSRLGIGFLNGRVFFGDTQGELGLGWTCDRTYPEWKFPASTQMPWTEFANYTFGFGLPRWESSVLMIPLWLLVVAAGRPTAILWWRDRRSPKAGFCKVCKYDLTGNVSGICPEYGTAIT